MVGVAVNLVFETLYEGMRSKYKESAAEKRNPGLVSVQDEFDSLKTRWTRIFIQLLQHFLRSLRWINKGPKYSWMNWARCTIPLPAAPITRMVWARWNRRSVLYAPITSFANPAWGSRHGWTLISTNATTSSVAIPHAAVAGGECGKTQCALKNKPLVIDIFTTAGNKLVVNNNLPGRTIKTQQ